MLRHQTVNRLEGGYEYLRQSCVHLVKRSRRSLLCCVRQVISGCTSVKTLKRLTTLSRIPLERSKNFMPLRSRCGSPVFICTYISQPRFFPGNPRIVFLPILMTLNVLLLASTDCFIVFRFIGGKTFSVQDLKSLSIISVISKRPSKRWSHIILTLTLKSPPYFRTILFLLCPTVCSRISRGGTRRFQVRAGHIARCSRSSCEGVARGSAWASFAR